MPTLFTDDGTGSNANPVGDPYTTWPSFNAFRRLGNTLLGTVASGNNGAYINSIGDQTASWIQARVINGVPTSNALMLRCATGASQGYVFQVYAGTAQIARWDSGSSYNVLVSAGSNPITTNDVMYFEAVGDALVAKINGTTVLSTTDATYASGRFGLYTYSDVDGLDAITAGNFSSSALPAAHYYNMIGRAH